MKIEIINFKKNIHVGFFEPISDCSVEVDRISNLILEDHHLNKLLFSNSNIWYFVQHVANLQSLVCNEEGEELLTAFCDIKMAYDFFSTLKIDDHKLYKLLEQILSYLDMGFNTLKTGEVFFNFYKN